MTKLWHVGVGLLVLAGCNPQPKVVAKSSGSIGITRSDALLYVADADHDRVTVIDTQTRAVVGHIPVGSRPERILVAPDDSVYVTNRGGRSVMRIAPGSMAVETVGTVGAEPVGMALSEDGEKLYVANSMSGSVSVLEAATLAPVDEVKVGGQPWAVQTLTDGRRAYVTDFTGGKVTVVDLPAKQVLSRVDLAQDPTTECEFNNPGARTPAQAADVVISPDGERAYVAHVQSRTRTTNGFASMALAVAPALSTVNTGNDQNSRDVTAGSPERPDFPATMLATQTDGSCQTRPARGMDAPSSLVVDGSGEWIFVADHNSNAVAVVSAVRQSDDSYRVPARGIYDVVGVGARPTGIAVSADLKTAYVHNAFDYTVSVMENKDRHLEATSTISFASSTLPANIERGRRLFYSAVDPRVTRPELGGVSCSSCHPDGRTDGLSWVLPPANRSGATQWTQNPTARNTQPLWGVVDTAPYHWDGKVADMPELSHVMVSQMGGNGLNTTEIADLSIYMKTLSPPDNPNQELSRADVQAGKQIFAERCGSCHAGTRLTDTAQHAAFVTEKTLDTPSLQGVFSTGPYLHDGSVRSLRELVRGTRFTVGEHDQRGQLDDAQTASLEEFLKTL
ncbi:MAG: c-type cytochrome [Myxococcaceae bacterium]